jgi:amino acid transporter
LAKSLGPVGVMLLTFSALSPVVSFYVAGDTVLHMAGTGAGLAYIVGAVGSALLALLFAEIGAAFPGAGGIYPSIRAILGAITSFPYIILLAPVAFAGTAYTALGFADYVAVFAPAAPPLLIAIAALLGALAIALLHLRASSLITGIFLAVECAALLVMSFVAAMHHTRPLLEVLTHPVMLSAGRLAPTPAPLLALATVSGLWATAGASWALYFAEEMHDARARIGRVIAWTGLIAALSIAVPMVLMVTATPDLKRALAAPSPLADFLAQTSGPFVANIVAAGVIIANFNCIVVSIMAYGRYLYSTGRDGIWPAGMSGFLSRLTAKGVPLRATALVGGVACIAAFLGERTLLIFISGNVADYILIALAVLVGRRRGQTGKDFAAPAYPVLPLFGLSITAAAMFADWLDVDAGRPSLLLLVALFFGAMLYFRLRLRDAARGWGAGIVVEAVVVELSDQS